ncbi:aldehyde dehydrogenase family protein [Paraburkholderia silvatlantica]|nr:aldehyde dehydrogenase family protein [Paraburkholderia silvatlantica]
MPKNSPLWRDEIFDPVPRMRAFDTEDEAIAMANDKPYGLVVPVATRYCERGTRVSNALEVRVVWAGAPQMNFPKTSWGGYTQSSLGRELCPFALAAYQEIKQVLLPA